VATKKDPKVYLGAAMFHLHAAREAMGGLVDSEALTSLGFVERLVGAQLMYSPEQGESIPTTHKAAPVEAPKAQPLDLSGSTAKAKPYHWLTPDWLILSEAQSKDFKSLKVCVWGEHPMPNPIPAEAMQALQAAPSRGSTKFVHYVINGVEYAFKGITR